MLHLQKIRLGPKLRGAESLTSFGVAGLQEVVEEVTAVRVLTQLRALGELALGVAHVTSPAGGKVGEQELVELEGVDDGHGAALQKLAKCKLLPPDGIQVNFNSQGILRSNGA